MAKVDPQTSALNDELADALTQIDALQSAAADAEARAVANGERVAVLEKEVDGARSDHDRLSESLRDVAVKYRDARLAASPHIPADLVTAEEVEEIDRQFAAAERVVSEMREHLEKERRQESRPVPAGSPVRRGADYSGLPTAEKIKLGLEQRTQG